MIAQRILPGLLLAAALLVAPSGARSQAVEQGAATFIESLASRAIDSLADPAISRPERIDRFRKLFNDHFAVRAIGQWVLGRYWPAATPEQQQEYLALFEDLIVVSYVDRFAQYAGAALKVVRSTATDPTNAIVQTEIVRPTGGPPVRVDWRVGSKDSIYKIVDVVVEGTSMSTTMRSDFSSIIRQSGGEVTGLLMELRKKTAGLKSAAAN